MSKKGIIYICTTSVEGLIKIGRTDNFNSRMNILEQNGYWNVSGLKRFYAVSVDDYIEKEKLIHTIFSKSQVANSELFALDKNLAKDMLDAFEGEIIYPEPCIKEPKKEVKKVDIIPSTQNSDRYKQLPHNEDEHISLLSKEDKEIYESLKQKLLTLDNVTITYKKMYINYSVNNKNFICIVTQRHHLIVSFNIPIDKLNDPKNITKDIHNIGHWGLGNYSVHINKDTDLDYVWNLITQCYNEKK